MMKSRKSNSNPKRSMRVEKVDSLPYVRIKWTKKQLQHLAELMESEPAKPPEALIRLMRARQADTD